MNQAKWTAEKKTDNISLQPLLFWNHKSGSFTEYFLLIETLRSILSLLFFLKTRGCGCMIVSTHNIYVYLYKSDRKYTTNTLALSISRALSFYTLYLSLSLFNWMKEKKVKFSCYFLSFFYSSSSSLLFLTKSSFIPLLSNA